MNGPPVQSKVRFALDEHLTVLSVSNGIEPLLGFDAEDFLKSRVRLKDRIHADDADIADMLFSSDLKEATGTFNIRLRHADGRIRCVKGEYTKKLAEDGVTATLDLLLEDAKRLWKRPSGEPLTAHFRALLETTDDFIFFKDRNHVFTAVNRNAMAPIEPGGPIQELLGQTDYDVLPEKYADFYYRVEKQIFAGIPVAGDVHESPKLDGRLAWLDNRKCPIRNENGEIVGLFGVVRDITEQIGVVQALRESEESLKESQRIAGLGTYMTDIRAGTWTSSEVLDGLLGIGAEYGRTVDGWAALVHPDDRDLMAAYFANEVVAKGEQFDKEYRIVRQSDGAVRWVHGLGRLEFDAQGRPVKMHGTIKDITERKLVADALRESEESLREAQRIAGLGSYVVDMGTGLWTNCEVAGRLLGIDEKYERTREGWVALVYPEDREILSVYFASEVVGKRKPFDKEFRIVRHSDGAMRWMHILGRVQFDALGAPKTFRGTFQDITDQRLIADALRESEESLKEAQKIAGIGSYVTDLRTGAATRSDVLLELLGTDRKDDPGLAGWRALIHPDDRARIIDDMTRLAAGKGGSSSQEFRIIRHSDGAVRWLHSQVRLELDSLGIPKKFRGTIQDITERRQADEALRESKELLQLFVEHAPAGLVMFDREMRYLAASHRWLKMHLLLDRDVIGKSHYEMFPNLPESWKAEHRRALSGESLPPRTGSLFKMTVRSNG